MIKLPRHDGGLILEHNPHKSMYESVVEHTSYEHFSGAWVSEEQKKKAIATDSLWVLQWYPATPVGFYKVIGADLEAVLNAALEYDND